MDKKCQVRKWFLATALAYLGTPYIWGGDDPSGFDCSGFVVECLKTAGLLNESEDYNADSLMRKFGAFQANKPCKGALLFTCGKSGRAFHVVICLDEYFQIGASGGGSQTTDSKTAWRDNAYVKIRPIKFDRVKNRVISLF
jgi:cell wall-associated NlpC family hydrolase